MAIMSRSGSMPKVTAVCLLQLLGLASAGYTQWHLVDVPSIICPQSETKQAQLLLDMDAISGSKSSPYIFTFYRTSDAPVTIAYGAVDANDKVVVPAGTTTTLEEHRGGSTSGGRLRRLTSDLGEGEDLEEVEVSDSKAPPAKTDPHDASETDNEWTQLQKELEEDVQDSRSKGNSKVRSLSDTVEDLEEAAEDDVMARSRRGGSRRGSWGGSSGSRRRSSWGGSSGSRRRGSPSSSSGSRRRGSPSSSGSRRRGSSSTGGSTGSRRRGTTSTTAARRRGVASSSGGSRRRSVPAGSGYSNPSSPNSGSYAYTPSKLNSNYGSASAFQSSYGYTGHNAYKMGTGTKVALALGAGAVVGYGAASLMSSSGYYGYGMYPPWSRWNTFGYGYGYTGWGYQCYYGRNLWTGTCQSCYDLYGMQCYNSFSYPENANRDDLMSTGFIPLDYANPITVTLTSVSGPDFMTSDVCPPDGWSLNNTMGWEPPTDADLFLTLTELDETEDEVVTYYPGGGAGYSEPHETGSGSSTAAIAILVPCCGIGLALGLCFMFSSSFKNTRGIKKTALDQEEDEEQEAE